MMKGFWVGKILRKFEYNYHFITLDQSFNIFIYSTFTSGCLEFAWRLKMVDESFNFED